MGDASPAFCLVVSVVYLALRTTPCRGLVPKWLSAGLPKAMVMFEKATLFSPVPPMTSMVRMGIVDPNGGGHAPFAVIVAGPDIGTTFAVKAVTANGVPYPRSNLTLTRGARRVTFLPESRQLVFLQDDIQHRDLWTIDLDTGIEQQLSNLAPDFDVRDFDISPDGREIVLQRSEEHSEVAMVDLNR